ncbi:MAG: GrlR family regulatory protein [Betaproteobacteria bacterium]
MLEGLWSAEFVSPVTNGPAGIAVFEAGRIVGGDGRYFYVGTYAVDGEVLMAEIKVTHYAGPTTPVFGPLREFTLYLSGEPHRDQFKITGEGQEIPGIFIDWQFTRRADLPAPIAAR